LRQDYRQTRDYHEYTQEQLVSRRISILAKVAGGILGVYVLAFWYLQVAQGDHYAHLSEENMIRKVRIPPPRGALFDRNGKFLVRNRMSFGLIVHPEQVADFERTLGLLGRALDRPPAEIEARIRAAGAHQRSFHPVLVAEDASLGSVAFIEARRADLPGVSISVEARRYYEGGASGAHLVGYVGEVSAAELDSKRMAGAERGDIVGKAGLEKYMDSDLRGEEGYRRVVVNSVGRETGDLAGGVAPRSGEDIRTSVDLDMQRALDLAFGPDAGAAVFLDPRTGEILALTSRPGYDPNLFVRKLNRSLWRALVADPRHPLQNRAIQSAFSPGSTFKVVVATAALAEGVITPSTIHYCGGKAAFFGRVFGCHERGGHGAVDLRKAITKSCNLFFYNVGGDLGISRIAEYSRMFGFGRPTGLGLGFEEAGLVPDEAWKQRVRGERWYPSETISVAIGQGPILVTPLQQALMAAAMATNGTRPVPRLRPVGSGEERAGLPRRLGEPLNPAILEPVRQGMWGVVNDGGTGWRAKIEGFDVCGKTGTTQVVAASAGVKDEEKLDPRQRDHSWFVGFAPLNDPRIAFAVFVEHGGHGAQAAAPIAHQVLQVFLKKRAGNPAPSPPMELVRGVPGAHPRLF